MAGLFVFQALVQRILTTPLVLDLLHQERVMHNALPKTVLHLMLVLRHPLPDATEPIPQEPHHLLVVLPLQPQHVRHLSLDVQDEASYVSAPRMRQLLHLRE